MHFYMYELHSSSNKFHVIVDPDTFLATVGACVNGTFLGHQCQICRSVLYYKTGAPGVQDNETNMIQYRTKFTYYMN